MNCCIRSRSALRPASPARKIHEIQLLIRKCCENTYKLQGQISEILKKPLIVSWWENFMADRIKIQCSKCRKSFGEKAQRLRTGYQVQCPHCMQLITFDSSSEDPNIRRPLKAARDFRIAAEEAVVLARMAAQAPKRDPAF